MSFCRCKYVALLFWLFPALTPGILAAGDAPPVEGAAPSSPCHFATRTIELDLTPVATGAAPLRSVQLWYTTDDGRTWQAVEEMFQGTAPVRFDAPSDGRFGFRAVAVDGAGGREPPPQPGTMPDFACVIDTRAPVLQVHAPAAGAKVYAGTPIVFDWEASDANLTAHPVTIEYRRTAEEPWQKLELAEAREARGHFQWFTPFVDGALEFRFEARDLAANVAHWELDVPVEVTPFVDFRGSRGMAADPCSSFRRFPLFYRITSFSMIEVAKVEIWFRKEMGEWQVTEDPDQISPYVFEADGDGTYYFCLRAVSRNGEGDRTEPGPDTPFDARVLVDTHPPDGELIVGSGAPELFHRAGEAIPLAWQVTEEHLAPGGCRLDVSIDDGASWILLKDGLSSRDGRGVFSWRPPLIEAERLVFRLTARDIAENSGRFTSNARVVLLNPIAQARATSSELHQRALAVAGRGDPESLALAIEKLDIAIQYDEKNAAAWHDRGVLRTILGSHDGALNDYVEAQKRAPGDIGFRLSVVQAHLNLYKCTTDHPREQFEAARDMFRTVARKDIYVSDDYRTLLATYRVLESELKEE